MIAEAAVGRDFVARREVGNDRVGETDPAERMAEREASGDRGLQAESRPTVPAEEEIEKLKRRRVPSARNQEIYRQVKILERSERDVARDCGLTQPRIFAICKQVRLWHEENGGNRPDQTPQASHNLAVANARLRLSYTFSQAAKWLEVSGQPSQTERIKAGEQTGDVVKKGPNPKPAFVGHMLRAAIELAKLEGAYAECKVPSTPVSGSANCRVATKEEPRQPTVAELSQTIREAETHTPPEELLSHRGAVLAFADLPTYRDEHANGLRVERFCEFTILDIAARRHFKTERNCYRAVAEDHAPPGDPGDVDQLIDLLVNLDITAAKADALALQEVLGSVPPEKERPFVAPQVQEQVSRRRLDYLERMLSQDDPGINMTDKSYKAVMARYRPETGRFDWQLDTGQRDLAMLLVNTWDTWKIEDEEEENEGETCALESEPVDPRL